MNRDLGRFGEAWAAAFLTRQGYDILDRNIRYRMGEIDLVARDGPDLVFVEVKCRRTRAFGAPQSAVTRRRFQHLAAAIDLYLAERNLTPPSYRVDVIALDVDHTGSVASCEHLKGVEAPPE